MKLLLGKRVFIPFWSSPSPYLIVLISPPLIYFLLIHFPFLEFYMTSSYSIYFCAWLLSLGLFVRFIPANVCSCSSFSLVSSIPV